VAGEDGLCFYKRIIKDAADWLTPNGYLVIEIGETQANDINKLLQNKLHFAELEIIKDLQGKERIIAAKIK
ncbi:MAG: peptide chain release factor N(5)-glutamine methyltransferase, partial [Gammaproteobacteria bacterium]|nr:peptide chain release factor N(5)-glutamine methyltransferase [Gammaproteobacteria bacterium]